MTAPSHTETPPQTERRAYLAEHMSVECENCGGLGRFIGIASQEWEQCHCRGSGRRYLVGFCHCGCGGKTTISERTDSRRGWIKGEPIRFIHGHRLILPLEIRFWLLVNKNGPGGCWLWTRNASGNGYCYITTDQGKKGVHVVSYEMLVGPIPEGMQLDHLCRVHPCVNPDHLEVVTQTENILRGQGFSAKHARKTHCPQGHPYDEANTLITPRRSRSCRACNRIRNRETKAAYRACRAEEGEQ